MGATLGVLALVGVGVSAAGEVMSGINAANQYEYMQAAAEYEADYARERAAVEETQFRRKIAQTLGRQRALSGARGGEVNTGSNLEVLADTAGQLEADAALIRYGGDLEAWRAKTAANLYGDSASTSRLTGFISGAGTLLTGASVYDQFFSKPKTKSPLYSKKLAGPQYPTGSAKRLFS